MTNAGPPIWHHSWRRPTYHLVECWLHRSRPLWKGHMYSEDGFACPEVLSQHHCPPESPFTEGPAAQLWEKQSAHSLPLSAPSRSASTTEPLPPPKSCPSRAACSGRGRCWYDSHSSPMQDNSDKPGFKGPSQVDFRLCSVPSPLSSCLVPVKCLHCSPACRDPSLKHTHGHSQRADLVPQALATLANCQRQTRSKGGKWFKVSSIGS